MATITIRDLDETVKARLGTQLHELFAGLGGDDLQFERRRDRPRAPDFGE
ncbi:MAG: hypothetical protein J2P15_12785 [Micromonosporaceae bacterium]|nr:hypothetical protein [Micromonosporaceae bacterium]